MSKLPQPHHLARAMPGLVNASHWCFVGGILTGQAYVLAAKNVVDDLRSVANILGYELRERPSISEIDESANDMANRT